LEIGLRWALRRLMAVALGVGLVLILSWSPASGLVDWSRYEEPLIGRACPEPVEGTTRIGGTVIRDFLHIRGSKPAAANLQSAICNLQSNSRGPVPAAD